MPRQGGGFADAKKIDAEVLLNSRLSPGQFHLLRQIQVACDTAKGCAARLTGKDAPAHENNEKTLADAKSRIEKVVAHLRDLVGKGLRGR